MIRIPEVDEVIEIGKEMGFDFTSAEAQIVQERMERQLELLDDFREMRIEEEKPPLYVTKRDPGYRPTESEDPLNAFIRKCNVEGAGKGLLKGKTVALKDHVSVAGVPMSFGSHMMDGYVPDFDATIVTRMLEQGANIVGKLNMDDFSNGGPGLGGIGDYGHVRNPYKDGHVTGGSSSGSGAAVAAGMVDIAIGGDQGGSIRIPSAWCGIVGIKATHGLIPHTGVYGSDPSTDYVGPMARSVKDVAAMLESIAGSDDFDPRQMHVPEIPEYTKFLETDVKGLKIGILSEGLEFEGIEEDVKEAALSAADVFANAGAEIQKISVPFHHAASIAAQAISTGGMKHLYDSNFGGMFAKSYYPTSLMLTFGRFKQSSGFQLPLNMKLNLTISSYLQKRYHGGIYAKGHNVRKTIAKAYDEAFAKVDVLLMPTTPIKAPVTRVPRDDHEALELAVLKRDDGVDISQVARNTRPFNYTGHPAISVPCAISDGLPIGLQLVAPHFQELRLLQLAQYFQKNVSLNPLPALNVVAL